MFSVSFIRCVVWHKEIKNLNVYVSTDATADAASCSTFASFILTLEKTEPKI